MCFSHFFRQREQKCQVSDRFLVHESHVGSEAVALRHCSGSQSNGCALLLSLSSTSLQGDGGGMEFHVTDVDSQTTYVSDLSPSDVWRRVSSALKGIVCGFESARVFD
jgi:hypothetical protein